MSEPKAKVGANKPAKKTPKPKAKKGAKSKAKKKVAPKKAKKKAAPKKTKPKAAKKKVARKKGRKMKRNADRKKIAVCFSIDRGTLAKLRAKAKRLKVSATSLVEPGIKRAAA